MSFLNWGRTKKSREPPRPHHQAFRDRLVELALHAPADFLQTCQSRAGLEAIWQQVGSSLPADLRLPCRGLDVMLKGAADQPIILVVLPEPARPNEAYFLCAVPAHAIAERGLLHFPKEWGSPLRFRLFGLERSELPDGGLIGFLVEWTGVVRRNYDAPKNGSPSSMMEAIIEAWSGTRPAITSMGMRLEREPGFSLAIDQLERATWFTEVGRPPVRGWPDALLQVQVLSSWDQVFAMLSRKRNPVEESAAALQQLEAELGSSPGAYQTHMNGISRLIHDLLNRKFPALSAPQLAESISLVVQMQLVAALSALQHPGKTKFHVAEHLVLLYAEGRLPCAWEGSSVTCIF